MTIRVVADNTEVDVKVIRFSDGGSSIKIDFPPEIEGFISVSIENEPVDSYHYYLTHIGSMINERYDTSSIEVIAHLPYFPHARADREFEDGMGVPLKTLLDAVTKYYNHLYTYDVHNLAPFFHIGIEHDDRGRASLFHASVTRDSVQVPQDSIFIAPDKGAIPSTRLVTNAYKSVMRTCNKTRDVKTGMITDVTSDISAGELDGKTCIITDDICDGGMTFILVADHLKKMGASEVWLYVTHGIFSKGLEVLDGKVDKVICYHTINNHVSLDDIREWNNR